MNADYSQPKVNPWLIALAVMLATFMEVLDTSIANVSLKYIAGSLSVSTDESTWVLTTYLIANAIIIPSTAWFGQRFGRKNFLMFCVIVFTSASFLCGLATSLPMLLVMRIIQGAGGGALQPIAQSIMLESFPKEKHGLAMGVYGIGVVTAPILGPVLGGWITDNYSWRWIFFINVPVGLLALSLMQRFIQDPHWIKNVRPPRLDVIGFGFMSLWLGCQEVLLDKGQEDDWFGSRFIIIMMTLAVIGLTAFVIRMLQIEKPFVNLNVLKNYNFSLGAVLMFFAGVTLYSMTAIIPLFLQTLMGYTALQSGLAMIPRGLGALIAMPLAGRLVGQLQGRYLVAGGFLAFAASTWALARLSLDLTPWILFWPLFLSGFSIGFMFVPLNTLALGSLKPEQIGNASGIFNLMRNVGGSIGISIAQTLLTRRTDVHQNEILNSVPVTGQQFQNSLGAAQQALSGHFGPSNALPAAQATLYQQLGRQAALWSFVDVFRWLSLLCFICVAVVWTFKKVSPGKPPAGAH